MRKHKVNNSDVLYRRTDFYGVRLSAHGEYTFVGAGSAGQHLCRASPDQTAADDLTELRILQNVQNLRN